MGMLGLYNWGLPNQGEHLNRYRENESLYNMACAFWSNLDSAAIYFMILFVILGILIACFYYYGYNRFPGRKYKVQHWVIWLVITVVATVAITLGLGNAIVTSNLQEKFGFLFRISLINGVYALAVYFISSVIICNLPIATNAYRFLKIGK